MPVIGPVRRIIDQLEYAIVCAHRDQLRVEAALRTARFAWLWPLKSRVFGLPCQPMVMSIARRWV